jgi:hypothetical protein
MPCPCRSSAMQCCVNSHMPCHATPLPFTDSAVYFVKARVLAGNIRTASPTVYRSSMLLLTFVELHVLAGRSRTRAGRPHTVFVRPILIHTCRAMPMPRCAVAFRSNFQDGMVVAGAAWERHGVCELALKQSDAIAVFLLSQTQHNGSS